MSHYIHGSDPAEQNRLARLNDLINLRCLPKLKLQKGFRVFDAGSGLGQLTFLMSAAVGSTGSCIGIERDLNQLAVARKNHAAPNLEFRQGDVFAPPFAEDEWGKFDFAHARFLLEHLSNPAKAVAQMIKALRPGGRIFLADDDHQSITLFPEPAGFQKLWGAYMDSYVEVGNDPFIGRKLAKLLVDQGMKDIRNDVVFFGDCAGTETFPLFADNLIGIIATSYPIMIEANLITDAEYESGIQNIRSWALLPDASLWYCIYVAEGVK